MIAQIKIGSLPKKKKKNNVRILLQFGMVITFIGFLGGLLFYFFNQHLLNCEGANCIIPTSAGSIKDPELKQTNRRTNILIVGIDTRSDNPGLMNTDTIILAQLDYQSNKMVLISFPRDLWVTYELGSSGYYASSKINSVYITGELNSNVNDGMALLKQVVSDITGEPIHYHVLVTLEGFKKAIDILGGLEIDVPNSFSGNYPGPGTSWIPVSFEEGLQTMDGETALQYARTRYSDSAEGSDFARARRQQIVIESFINQVKSTETLLNPSKIWDLFQTLKDTIQTSEINYPMDIKAALSLKDKIETSDTINIVLDPMFGGEINKYIYNPQIASRGYTIQARDESFKQIQNYLSYIFQFPDIFQEQPTLVIYNATGNSSFETDYFDEIQKDNILIKIFSGGQYLDNSDNKYSGIKIYDYTNGEKSATAEYLKKFFKVSDTTIDSSDTPTQLYGEDFAVVVADENVTQDQAVN